MMLRPHHLLCIRAYRGKGYNTKFIDNMDKIVDRIKSDRDFNVEITFGTDDICEFCINKIKDNKCNTNEKVNAMDEKVIRYFNIKEGNYNFKELNKYIDEKSSEEIICDICSNCEWYKNSNCKNYILEGIEKS